MIVNKKWGANRGSPRAYYGATRSASYKRFLPHPIFCLLIQTAIMASSDALTDSQSFLLIND